VIPPPVYVERSVQAPDRPRLSPNAQILPAANGWLVRHRGDSVLLASPAPHIPLSRLLEQMDGSRDLPTLARAHELTLDELSALVESMARLALFDAAPLTPENAENSETSALPDNERIALPPLEVLIVGGGLLSRQVSGLLSRITDVHLRAFDPARSYPTASAPEAGAPVTAPELVAVLQSRLATAQVVICCVDQPTALTADVAAACRDTGVSAVFAQLTEAGGRVGPPLVGPRTASTQGCPICIEHHEADRDRFAAALPAFLATRRPRPAPWQYPHRTSDVTVIARLALLSLCNALEIARGLRPSDDRVTAVDFNRRTVTAASVAPHPACRVCFPLARQSAADARAHAQHQWRTGLQHSPSAPSNLRDRLPQLRALTGARYGLFDPPHQRSSRERHAVWKFFRERGVDPKHNALANAHSVRVLRREVQGETIHHAVTEGLDFDDADRAEALALMESLERLFALSFRSSDRLVQARFVDVAAEALDPRSFPLYADEQYDEPGFPLQRFDPKRSIEWVWGVDLTAGGAPVLVAADLVFGSRGAARLFHANSNGAACHSSLLHAAINAIYETVERDALMVIWLNHLSLPGVAFERSDPDPGLLRQTLGHLDFELEHVDITTDLGIPVLMSVLRDRRNPNFFLLNMVGCLDAEAQLHKLYRELAQFVFPYLINRQAFVNACTHDPDPSRVQSFPDHLAFYQAADKIQRSAFLTSATRSRPFCAPPNSPWALQPRAELDWLVSQLASRGHRTLVVNCTTPLLRDRGLCAVKVLVPGLQPLNCGHRLRPLGGERVLTVAQRMGLTNDRRKLADLNPWPHPFW
jgi:thiazole/oxazole-forming peptide maturase SagD family component